MSITWKDIAERENNKKISEAGLGKLMVYEPADSLGGDAKYTPYKENAGGSKAETGGAGKPTGFGGLTSEKSYRDAIDAYKNNTFSYDYTKDPSYKAYEKEYKRNGQFAMDDTLAKVAARTGGVASSYAVSAAGQAYNDYMAGLTDKIPALEQAAYNRYLNDQEKKLNEIALAKEDWMQESEYHRILDKWQNMGKESLTDEELSLMSQMGGWFTNNGETYTDKNGSYATNFDPTWTPLNTFQNSGFNSMTQDQIKDLTERGWTWDEKNEHWVSPAGERFGYSEAYKTEQLGRATAEVNLIESKYALALAKARNGVQPTASELELLVEYYPVEVVSELMDIYKENKGTKKGGNSGDDDTHGGDDTPGGDTPEDEYGMYDLEKSILLQLKNSGEINTETYNSLLAELAKEYKQGG